MERRLSLQTAAGILAVALFIAGCSKTEDPAPPDANTPMAQASSDTGAVTSTPSSSETSLADPGAGGESKPVEKE
jgi:hypothetical protein